jgi:hypothetical protein
MALFKGGEREVWGFLKYKQRKKGKYFIKEMSFKNWFLLMIINRNVLREASSKGKWVQEITMLLSEIISAIFSKSL